MDNNRCNDCRWWVAVESLVNRQGQEIGDCRRRSPRVMQTQDGRTHASFPRVPELHFCGDFKPRHVEPMEVADA